MDVISGLHSRRVRLCLALILAVIMALKFQVVEACGCGVYLPSEGEASISEEHVLIRWDGKTEDIVMSLGVLGSSREAAVIFPVPTRATVKLADARVFDVLQELTKPIVRNEIMIIPPMGGGAASPSVLLLERQTIGPFDVSTLAATDANALGDWLASNGYNLPPEVVNALEPYVEQGWYYIAVRLSPGAGLDELTGTLDPLWITFNYDRIIYPMRPTALARDYLTVFIYVLADHRVQKPMSFGYQEVKYANWVEPATLGKDSPLAPFVQEKLFLTKIVEEIYDPQKINDDFVFEFTNTDEIYRDVEYNYIYGIGGIPFCLLIPCGFVLVMGLFAVGGVLARKRNPDRKQL